MPRRIRVWTEDEDRVLLSQVKANPQNLSLAFQLTSEEINRTKGAISNRWYTVLSKRENKDNTCFMTISKEMYGRNRKNLKEPIPAPEVSRWRRILNFFFN